MADIFTMIGDALGINKGKATTAAAAENLKFLKQLGIDIEGLIDTGTETQAGYLQDSLDLSSLGPNAEGILGDIYGLNGPEGNARVTDRFRTSPGYDFKMNSGLDALARRASSYGMLGSGNTSLDTIDFASGLADQEWDDWVSGITSGIDRQIGTQGDMATLYGNDTNQRIGLKEGIGNARMGLTNQKAAGQEAGQGWLLDLVDTVAGTVGAFTGGGGFGKGGTGQGNTGAATYPGGGGFYMGGYGKGF